MGVSFDALCFLTEIDAFDARVDFKVQNVLNVINIRLYFYLNMMKFFVGFILDLVFFWDLGCVRVLVFEEHTSVTKICHLSDLYMMRWMRIARE